MKLQTESKFIIIVALLVVAALAFVLNTNYETKADAMLAIANDNLQEQESLIETELDGLKVGGDAYRGQISIADCSRDERIRFDQLLGSISSADRGELLELDELYDSCAYYFSTIQTVGAAQVDREVEVYFDMLRELAVFDESAATKLETESTWDEIITLSSSRSALHHDLVVLQHDIVTELLSAKGIDHPDVQALVSQGNEIRENIFFVTQQIDELRTAVQTS